MDQKPKILLIDADADFVEQAREALEGGGCEVITALSGREGLDKVRFEQPDLIVLDLMLEKHDTGFAVAKTLKADPVTTKIPVLMVSSAMEKTGFDFSQDQDGYWMKTDEYVNKPIPLGELAGKVRKLLENSRKKV